MAEGTLIITDENFDAEVIQSTVPVLVDFWAPWCGPCRQIAPVVEELAKDYAGRLKVGKYNVDDHQKKAEQFGIRGIPALLFFKGGAIADTVVGAVPKSHIVAKAEKVVG